MRSAISALMTSALLTGCAPGISKTQPDVIPYSRDFQKQAAAEVLGGSCPALTEMAKDYCVMRDQARAGRGEKPTCTR
jgi:hypothetical protein